MRAPQRQMVMQMRARTSLKTRAQLAKAEPGKTKLGFAGIGIMGLAMTRNLLKAGTIYVFGAALLEPSQNSPCHHGLAWPCMALHRLTRHAGSHPPPHMQVTR